VAQYLRFSLEPVVEEMAFAPSTFFIPFRGATPDFFFESGRILVRIAESRVGKFAGSDEVASSNECEPEGCYQSVTAITGKQASSGSSIVASRTQEYTSCRPVRKRNVAIGYPVMGRAGSGCRALQLGRWRGDLVG
jgi:hypothetical protein